MSIAGTIFIAVRDEYQAIKGMSCRYGFNGVTDQFTAGQGIFHAHMTHSDAVADTDGRNQNGGAACHAHAVLDGLGQLVQVHVAGHNLAVGGNHTNQRAVQFLRRVAQA